MILTLIYPAVLDTIIIQDIQYKGNIYIIILEVEKKEKQVPVTNRPNSLEGNLSNKLINKLLTFEQKH